MKKVWKKFAVLFLVLLLVVQIFPTGGVSLGLAADDGGFSKLDNVRGIKKSSVKNETEKENVQEEKMSKPSSVKKETAAEPEETSETTAAPENGTKEPKKTTETEETAETPESKDAVKKIEETTEMTESKAAAEKTEEKKTSFSYEDDKIVVTAKTGEDAEFSKNTQLCADFMFPDGSDYKRAVSIVEARLLKSLKADKKNTDVDYIFYDIYFQEDGKRLEPESGTVNVSVEFKTPIFEKTEENILNFDVVHIKNDGTAEIVTDKIDEDNGGKVKAVTFCQDSFSPVGVVRTAKASGAPEDAVKKVDLNQGIQETDGKKIGGEITSAEMLMNLDGEWMTVEQVVDWLENPSNKIPKETPVTVSVDFKMGEDTYLDADSRIFYGLPEVFNVETQKDISMNDMDNTSNIIGKYSIDADTKKIVITPNEDFLTENYWHISMGNFSFNGTLSEKWWEDPQDIPFGKDVTIDIPFNGKDVVKKELIIEKELKDVAEAETGGTETDNIMSYQITVTAPETNTVSVPSVTVEDIFNSSGGDVSEFMELDENSVKIRLKEASGGKTEELEVKKSDERWVIGAMAPGTAAVITYNMKLKDGYSFYSREVQGIINNTATAYSNNDSMATASETYEIRNELALQKEVTEKNGQSFYTDADGILWVEYSMTVTAAKNNTAETIRNVIVEDEFTNSQKQYIEDYEWLGVTKTPDAEIPQPGQGNASEGKDAASGGTPDYITGLDKENKTFTWKIAEIGKGETYTLYYRVKVSNDIFTAGTENSATGRLENMAVLQVNGRTTATSSAEAKATKQWVKKNGSKVSEDRYKFNITINDGAPYGIGAISYIHDELIGDFKYVGDLEIEYWYHGQKENTNADHPNGSQKISFDTMKIVSKKSDAASRAVQEWWLGAEKMLGSRSSDAQTEEPKEETWNFVGEKYAGYWNGDYTIVLTYEAEKTGNMELALGNHAGVVITEGEHSSDWMGSNGNSVHITKNYKGGAQTREPSWESAIPVDVRPGDVFSDTVGNPEEMWMTQEQLDAVKVIYNGKEMSKKTPENKEGQYEITGTLIEDPSSSGEKAKYSGFTIRFYTETEGVTAEVEDEKGNVKGNPLRIQYNTTLGDTEELEDEESNTYKNSCWFSLGGSHKASASAECSYTKSLDISKSIGKLYKEDEGDVKKGTITWFLTVNKKGLMAGDAVIKERIPEGLDFKDAVLIDENGNELTSNFPVGGMTIEKDPDDESAVNLILSGVKENTAVRIKITTAMNEDDYKAFFETNGEGKKDYKNQAILAFDGTEKIASAALTVDERKLDKVCDSSTQSLWPYAEYTAVVNPEGLDLGKGSETSMTFTDKMTIQKVTDASADPEIQVYPSGDAESDEYYKNNAAEILVYDDNFEVKYFIPENGNVKEIAAVRGGAVSAEGKEGECTYVLKSVAENSQGFVLEIPDNIKVEITYRVMFNVLPDWKVTISNKASYDGAAVQEKEDETEITVHEPAGSLRSNGKLSLVKRDAAANALLSGAKFRLDKIQYANDDKDSIIVTGEPSDDAVYVTDGAGTVTFRSLDKTTGGIDSSTIVYCYRETEAPKGYRLDDTPHFFAFAEADDTMKQLIAEYYGLEKVSILPAVSKNQHTIKNELILGKIQVTKKVTAMKELGMAVDLTAKEEQSFKVGLYTRSEETGQYELYTKNPYTNEAYAPVQDIVIKEGKSEGTLVYENLPVGEYYVFELDEKNQPIVSGTTVGKDTANPYLCTVTVDASESQKEDAAGTGSNGPLEIAAHYENYKENIIPNRVTIENMYYDLPDGYTYEASIILNKKVLKGGEAYDTEDVFYAGIFTKNEENDGNTFPYTLMNQPIVLKNNETLEIGVPLGGENGDRPMTYFVFETDENGEPIVVTDEDGNRSYNQPFVYDVTLSSVGENGENNCGEVYVQAGGHPEVTITNQATQVSIEKRDSDGAPLAGAALELWKAADSLDAGSEADQNRKKNKAGDVLLETWVSDGTPHVLTAQLAVGGSYYIKEARQPENYLLAGNIPFTVEDGEPMTLIMEDEKAAGEKGKISVTKRIFTLNDEFEMEELIAEDAVFYVGLFTDAEGKHPYGENYVKEIHLQDKSSETIVYDNLPSGTYHVFETEKDGTIIPYEEMQDINAGESGGFYCTGGGEDGKAQKITLDLDAGKREGETELHNVYIKPLPDGFAYAASIDITKSVIKNGNPVDTGDSFYAGIFTGETETKPYKVVALKNNGMVTVEVPLGGDNGMEPVQYYVYETDANGNKIDKAAFTYTVSGEGTVALNTEISQGKMIIINTAPSDPSETTAIREKKSSDKDTGTDAGKDKRSKSAKTGDGNRAGCYLLFFAAAAAGSVIALKKRGKHARK